MSIAGILFLAFFVEGFVEYLFSKEGKHQPALKYIALGVGVMVSIAYKVDILAMVDLTTSIPFFGQVVSGLIIGRGSNYVSDIITKLKGGDAN